MIKEPYSEFVFSTRNLFDFTKFKSDSIELLFYNDLPLICDIKNNKSKNINWSKKADVIRKLRSTVIIIRPETCINIPDDDIYVNINYDSSYIEVDKEIYESMYEENKYRSQRRKNFMIKDELMQLYKQFIDFIKDESYKNKMFMTTYYDQAIKMFKDGNKQYSNTRMKQYIVLFAVLLLFRDSIKGIISEKQYSSFNLLLCNAKEHFKERSK